MWIILWGGGGGSHGSGFGCNAERQRRDPATRVSTDVANLNDGSVCRDDFGRLFRSKRLFFGPFVLRPEQNSSPPSVLVATLVPIKGIKLVDLLAC